MKNRKMRMAASLLIAGAAIGVVRGESLSREVAALGQLEAKASALGVNQLVVTPLVEGQPVRASMPAGTRPKAALDTLFATPETDKTEVACEYKGRVISVKILRWETGVMITKDAEGKEVRQEYKYPILAPFDGAEPMGDGAQCWNICRQVCNGYGVCWLSCTYHCTSQGGPGDPRKP